MRSRRWCKFQLDDDIYEILTPKNAHLLSSSPKKSARVIHHRKLLRRFPDSGRAKENEGKNSWEFHIWKELILEHNCVRTASAFFYVSLRVIWCKMQPHIFQKLGPTRPQVMANGPFSWPLSHCDATGHLVEIKQFARSHWPQQMFLCLSMCVLLSLEPRNFHRLALSNKNKGRETLWWHLHLPATGFRFRHPCLNLAARLTTFKSSCVLFGMQSNNHCRLHRHDGAHRCRDPSNSRRP